MTIDQITAWVAADESETLEFKRSTGQRREDGCLGKGGWLTETRNPGNPGRGRGPVLK